MNFRRQVESDLLAATSRTLAEQGYSVVIEPGAEFLPDGMKRLHPDAIAIGRDPKLVIEIARERPADARRIAELQRLLRGEPGWKLHLILDRASADPILTKVSDDDIASMLERAPSVARIDGRAALMMGWAALEALGRERRPDEFGPPQSPARIIERLASNGTVTPSEADVLRGLARKRDALVHGDLVHTVDEAEIAMFVDLLRRLLASSELWGEPTSREP